jgi:serine/threonine-protein kinase
MLDQGQKTTSTAPPRGPQRLGRYELIARVGEDAIAEVHIAREVGAAPSRKAVAIKMIHSHLARDKEFIGVLLDDARASALIQHPRVIDIYDVGVSRGTYFIAMEYVIGPPLAAVLARASKAGLPGRELDVYTVARIVADVADGLHAGHTLRSVSGRPLELVHRGVNPSSIILLYDGSAKLADFGVARARAQIGGTAGAERTGVRARESGATGYAAPEQLTAGVVDRRSDVFSLGVVLWEALAGRPLFGAQSRAEQLKQIMQQELQPPSAHRPEVPYELDEISMRALAVDQGARFQSAGNMQTAIEAFLRDAGFRREDGALFRFLEERFAAERDEQRALVKRAGDPAAPPDLARGSERRQPILARNREENEGDTSVKTFVDIDDDGTGSPMARGSQYITTEPSRPASAPGSRPLVPMPPPDPRTRKAAATAAPVREGRPTAAGTGTRRGRASSQVPRPRGKGRTGRIETIADAWSDRAASPTSRTLPLPAPTDAADLEPDESALTPRAEPEEDDDDFTVVEPTKLPRSFEAQTGAVARQTTASAEAASEPVAAEMSSPIIASSRSRGIWMAASVIGAAVLLIGALLFAALGSSGDRATQGDEPLAAAAAQEPIAETAAPRPIAQPGAQPAAQPAIDAAKSVAPAAPEIAEPPAAEIATRDDSAKRRRGQAQARKAARRAAADPAELYSEGARLYVRDDLVQARRKFQKAVNVSPRFAPAYRGLGLVYERAGDKARAIRSFQNYLRLAPYAPDVNNIRARLERLRM